MGEQQTPFEILAHRVGVVESKIDRLIWTIAIAGCTGTGSLLFFTLQSLASAHGIRP